MAGQKRRGRQITAEALDEKISKAQDKLVATKKAYDEAAQELRNLLEKRDAIRKDDLYNRLVKSAYRQIACRPLRHCFRCVGACHLPVQNRHQANCSACRQKRAQPR